MPRRSQTTIDWLAVVCFVCFIAGTLVATARALEDRQAAFGLLALLVVFGLISLVKVRGRRLGRALRNMVMGGLVSLVLGFVLLRLLVTYSMAEQAGPVDAELARQPEATSTAIVTALTTVTVMASPTVDATVEATAEATVEATAEATVEATTEATVVATLEAATIAASCGQATVSGVIGLNIRSEPGTGSAVLGNIAAGSTVELLCTPPAEANRVVWRRVRSGNVEGWMSERYLTIVPTPEQ